jgi:hypothetical protein
MARGRPSEAARKSAGRRTIVDLAPYHEADPRMGLFQMACTDGQDYRDFALPIPGRNQQLRSDKADMPVTGPQVRRRTAVAVGCFVALDCVDSSVRPLPEAQDPLQR